MKNITDRTVQGMYVHSEDNYVHIHTPFVADTLCGCNDCPGYELTDNPVDCPSCLKLLNWCKKLKLK